MMHNQGTFKSILPAFFVGTVATILVLQSQPSESLSPTEVGQIVKAIAVKIDGAKMGTGFIIARQGNTYTVLTNWHVVDASGNYTLSTIDGQRHKITRITQIAGIDAAVVYFTSNKNYQVGKIGNSNQLKEGQIIHYGGYPGADAVAQNRTYAFYGSQMLIGFLNQSDIKNGYELIFSGAALPGMSGSPIVDDKGRILGIYGLATVINHTSENRLFGIPIDTVIKFATRYNIALGTSERESESTALPSPTPQSSSNPSPTPESPGNERLLSKLQLITVFAIADEKGVPLVAVREDNEKRVTGVFISQRDAQTFLAQLQKNQPEVAQKVKIQAITLAQAYKLQVHQKEPGRLIVTYVPIESEVEVAKNLLSQRGQQYEGGVPLFVAKAGKEQGYITINKNKQQISPFFFAKADLDKMIEQFKKQNPQLASTVKIEVVTLERVIKTLETNSDSRLDKIYLIPTQETREFMRSNSNN